MADFFTQAYKQAPWRLHKIRGGAILLGIIGIAVVALLYVFIINERAAAGVQIQQLEIERRDSIRNISTLRTQLAYITSASQLRARALEMGFQPMNPEDALYIVIPGYQGRQAQIPLEIYPESKTLSPSDRDSYHTSLWDWLQELFFAGPEAIR